MLATSTNRIRPYSVHLTAEEAAALVAEAEGVDPDLTPLWSMVYDKLRSLLDNPGKVRA